MTGLEILASIATIISAFGVISQFLKDFAKYRQSKKLAIKTAEQKAEDDLLAMLQRAPTEINSCYNVNINRLGQAFEQGDGTAELVSESNIFQLLRDHHCNLLTNS